MPCCFGDHKTGSVAQADQVVNFSFEPLPRPNIIKRHRLQRAGRFQRLLLVAQGGILSEALAEDTSVDVRFNVVLHLVPVSDFLQFLVRGVDSDVAVRSAMCPIHQSPPQVLWYVQLSSLPMDQGVLCYSRSLFHALIYLLLVEIRRLTLCLAVLVFVDVPVCVPTNKKCALFPEEIHPRNGH